MEWMLMPLKRYAEFGGRSRRQEYWMYQLLLVVIWTIAIVTVLAVGFGAAGYATSGGGPNAAMTGMMGMIGAMGILGIVFLIVWLGLLIPTLAVSVRRLHDTNRSGWWLLLAIAPYVLAIVFAIMGATTQSGGLAALAMIFSLLQWIGIITLIVFFCLPGTPGPNKYGPDPLGGAANLNETFS